MEQDQERDSMEERYWKEELEREGKAEHADQDQKHVAWGKSPGTCEDPRCPCPPERCLFVEGLRIEIEPDPPGLYVVYLGSKRLGQFESYEAAENYIWSNTP